MSNSIDSRNRIWLTLDQKVPLYPGDRVSGVVHLDCQVSFSARGILVKFKGFERGQWEEKFKEKVEDRTVERIRIHKESNDLFRSVLNVYPCSGVIDAGQYEFPFNFTLPSKLPGVFCETSSDAWGTGKGWEAKVLYKVKACADVSFKSTLKHTLKLVVREPIGGTEGPSAEGAKSFLTGSGKMMLRIWQDKPAYSSGSTAILRIQANNTGTNKPKKLKIGVFRKLTVNPNGKKMVREQKVYEQVYAGFGPLFFGLRYIPYTVPLTALPSTLSSKVVRNEYTLAFVCAMPKGPNLSIRMPIAVFASTWLFDTPPATPPFPAPPLPSDTSFRPEFQSDRDAPTCNACHSGFSLTKRRHHCRHCLKIFCKQCSTRRMVIPNLGFTSPERLCEACIPMAQTGGKRVDIALASASQRPLGEAMVVLPAQQATDKMIGVNDFDVPSRPQSTDSVSSTRPKANSFASVPLSGLSLDEPHAQLADSEDEDEASTAEPTTDGGDTNTTTTTTAAATNTPASSNPFEDITPAEKERLQRKANMERRLKAEQDRNRAALLGPNSVSSSSSGGNRGSTYVPGLLGDDPGDNPFM